MTVYCLGSINADNVYSVPHLPAPGETLAATGLFRGLGGKGANQSVAAALGGARVVHIGAVGPDGRWAVDRLAEFGVDTAHVVQSDHPTGHAIINVAPDGENAIVIFPGANARQDGVRIEAALADAGPGDTLLMQNETSHQAEAAALAVGRGMHVVYSAAPFDLVALGAVLPRLSLLVLNAVEAAQMRSALGEVTGPEVIVTDGANGATWYFDGQCIAAPAFPVKPMDTTGAGDCFIGSLVAALDLGKDRTGALRYATAAAAIQVTRPGTTDAMPTLAEVRAFLTERA
ncbi:ribokinase [Rhodovulum marinum]|uniref:Ribokinase n=1 Tax=Rhodovulum marinum TaxID=320662 RepID=A0A4R2Q0X1_9RHOB|nr:ribokinase [Rhodovulum marinum]TCP40275.1 ribokinase [Rhodovulum marinum]